MVSEMMLEDAEELAKRGILLTPREVVRLNAYGLRAERGTYASALFQIRRCAILGGVAFCEPTIGHHVWMAEVERVVDLGDAETYFAVRALWLATASAESLPSSGDARAVRSAVMEFARGRLSGHTLREVNACMDYAENGADAASGEDGPRCAPAADADEHLPLPDWCSEIGVVRDGQSLGLGIPLRDALSMTHAHLRAVVDRAYDRLCGDGGKESRQEAVGDYYRILDEIVEAHRNG